MPSKATISVGEKFLYDFKAGPAGGLRPPSGRQRHAGHRGTGLTLHVRWHQSTPNSRTQSEADSRRPGRVSRDAESVLR